MSQSRVQRCLEAGLSVLVGTADAAGMPSCCRGTAISAPETLDTITVYMPVATSHEAIQNLATTKKLAVTVTHPRDNFATQFKGEAIETRLARDDEKAFVRAQLDAFADILDRIGVPRRVTRSLTHWPAFAVTMRVEQTFEQTPGPNAGRPVA